MSKDIKNIDDYLLENIFMTSTQNYDFDDFSKDLLSRCYLNAETFQNSFSISEGYGISKDCIQLSKSLSKAIQKWFENTNEKTKEATIDNDLLNKFEYNKYVNKLSIYVSKKNTYKDFKGEGYYNPESGYLSWNIDTNKFECCEISIELPEDFFEYEDSCADILIHELQHIVQDYYRHKGSNKSMKLDKLAQRKYIKIKKLSSIEFIERYMKKEECNAYIAQIEGELNNKQFSNYKKAIDWLDKNSEVWQGYKVLRKYCEEETTDKELQKLFHKNWKKFINHLYHLLKEHVTSTKILEKSTRNIKEEINELINKDIEINI